MWAYISLTILVSNDFNKMKIFYYKCKIYQFQKVGCIFMKIIITLNCSICSVIDNFWNFHECTYEKQKKNKQKEGK